MPQPIRIGDPTPWGAADSIVFVLPGNLTVDARRGDVGQITLNHCITRVCRPRHGGYYVPDALLARIPVLAQNHAQYWSGDRHWFEEDCAWAHVALALPEFFPADAQVAARATIDYLNQTA